MNLVERPRLRELACILAKICRMEAGRSRRFGWHVMARTIEWPPPTDAWRTFKASNFRNFANCSKRWLAPLIP